MKRNNLSGFLCCFLLLSAFFSRAPLALESDADQPIIIDSNTATYDDKTEVSIYTGNVVFVQGSIRVKSDKLDVYFVNGETEKLVFTGKPAKFKQKPHEGDEDITGEALIGEYYPKKDLLVLKKDATVWQGNGAYSSDYIQYDIKTSLVKAGEKSTDAKRVHVVITPKSKQQ